MMLGGGLMMLLGLFFLLLIIAIPVVLVIIIAGGAAGLLRKENTSPALYQKPVYSTASPTNQSEMAGGQPSRYCSHCGAGLQADWTHCPQCGAPIS